MNIYTSYQQTLDYRRAAWDLGCRCPLLTPPHVHLIDCPLFETPAQMAQRLEDEHFEDVL